MHAHCLTAPLYNALFTQYTAHHSWGRSLCTDSVAIWLIVPVENLTELPAVFQKRPRQRNVPLFTEQRRCFLAAQQQAINDRNHRDECQHISKHSSSLWLVCARAGGDLTAGLQHLRASPPVSTFRPSDTVTTGDPRGRSDMGSVCSSAVEPRTAQPHGAAERGAVSLSIE